MASSNTGPAMSILERRDKALGEVIAGLLGKDPVLHVMAQERRSPPHPEWVAPPLNEAGPFLVRCTGYRMEEAWLSRNIAYVDLSAVDPDLAGKLEREEVNLGQIFGRPGIAKSEFDIGSDEVEDMQEIFDRCFPPYPDRFVWRRYTAAIDGTPTFAVAEALPVETWERLLAQPTDREDR